MSEKRKNPIADWWQGFSEQDRGLVLFTGGVLICVMVVVFLIGAYQETSTRIQNNKLSNTPCAELATYMRIHELPAACIVELGLQDVYQFSEENK